MGTDKRFALVGEAFDRLRAGTKLEQDEFARRFRTFLNDPSQVDDETWAQEYLSEGLQNLWQSIYDELGIETVVPPIPRLTANQRKSLKRFRFMMMYIPMITGDSFPSSFTKPQTTPGDDSYINCSSWLLVDRWVAVEVIAKSYNDDRLAAAVRLKTRFDISYDALEKEILAKIARAMGFPHRKTHLPCHSDWIFIANMFNWLREKRDRRDLPDLGINGGWEWTNTGGIRNRRFAAGHPNFGGVRAASVLCDEKAYPGVAFRVLIEI